MHGPWDYRPIAASRLSTEGAIETRSVVVPPPGRTRVPVTWTALLGTFRGRVEFRRRFHRPRQLDSAERVWLVFERTGCVARVSLNRTELLRQCGPACFEFDLTPVLDSSNELLVEIDCPRAAESDESADGESADPTIALSGTVALEVRGPVFLRAVSCVREPVAPCILQPTPSVGVRVTGLVVGDAPFPVTLDLTVSEANTVTSIERRTVDTPRPSPSIVPVIRRLGVNATPDGSHFEFAVIIPSTCVATDRTPPLEVLAELHGAAVTLDRRHWRLP